MVKLCKSEGLCYVSVKPVFVYIFLFCTRYGIGGHDDKGLVYIYLIFVRISPDFLDNLHTAHLGHHMVQEYHVITDGAYLLYGLFSGGRTLHCNLHPLQEASGYNKIGSIIINNQYLPASEEMMLVFQIRGICIRYVIPYLFFRQYLLRDMSRKYRSYSVFTLHFNEASHEIKKAFDYGKSQAGPLYIVSFFAVDPFKGIKEVGNILLLDTDACIPDGNIVYHLFALASSGHFKTDGAFLCVFDGIIYDVGDDLTYPDLIPLHISRQILIHRVFKQKTLGIRIDGEELNHVLQKPLHMVGSGTYLELS